jgi:hypothetical protein
LNISNSQHLQNFIAETIANLEQVRLNGVKSEFHFEIDCSNLDNYLNNDIRKSERFADLFKKLKSINGPTLYWIEIISQTEGERIIYAINKFKDAELRTTPALKTGIDYNSRILYVGKVKGVFWGRLIQHLGFFTNPQTQGLQIYHWAKDLSLTVRFNLIELAPGMADLMAVIEYAFAKRLKPLTGKHK